MSKSRLEKFLYALYSLDSSDLPSPLSRIEELYKCWVTGEEAPTFEPLSRVEKYLMAILGVYDVDSLPNPISRVEVLLYKLATGDDNLDDVEIFLSEHEELLAEIIRNGGVGGNIDIEYVLYTLSTEHNTLYNTAEKPVKSAILKGNTLVNLVNDVTSNEVGNYSNSPCKIKVIRNLQNETLTIIFNVISLEIPDGADGTLRIGGGWSGQIRCQPTLGVNKVLYNYNQTSNSWLGVFSNSGAYNLGQRITISDVMVLEGDYTNIDTPYFEGMQSVKMPVLTTVGKNLLNNQNNSKDTTIDAEGTVRTFVGRTLSDYVKVSKNKQYVFSGNGNSGNYVAFFDNSKTFIERIAASTFTPKQDGYIRVFQYNSVEALYQIEESSKATEYEPYKSTTVTCNEEVELRGIGEVKDELNLLRGKLTQRIGEVVLDGSEDETYNTVVTSFDGSSNTIIEFIPSENLVVGLGNDYTNAFLSNYNYKQFFDVNWITDTSSLWGVYLGITDNKTTVRIIVADGTTYAEVRQHLQENPLRIVCKLETPTIKTVDLSVVDQDGNDTKLSTFNDITHVTLSSEELIPEAELEVATKNEEDLEDSSVYTTHTLSEEFNTLYNTAEKPVKSAILKGSTLVNITNKLPVLKTVGKNLFDKNLVVPGRLDNGQLGYTTDSTVTIFDDGFEVVSMSKYRGCVIEKIKINGSSEYYFSYNINPITEGFSVIFYFLDRDYNYISKATAYTGADNVISTPSNAAYVSLWFNTSKTTDTPITLQNIQFEEDNNATEYEPFQSNILTVNEDVTLRSNGDVYDELNLLTGRLTQRIDENNEVLAQAVVKTVDLSVVDQDGNNTKLKTFNDITHVTLSSEGLIPEAELEVAEKVPEVAASMLAISREQEVIDTTTNEQSENVDATMIATTEIYEDLL